ncbi:MAG: DUF177 domain-containing protein [Bacteroidia bacterium]|nr:DUF177 domain-containing protein [Bacteroidia bacterium]
MHFKGIELKEFSIPFVGLANKKYTFNYHIDKKFFDNFEFSPVKDGDLAVKLTFDKQDAVFILDFDLKGNVELTCDLCSDSFSYEISKSSRAIIKLSGNEMEDTDEILYLENNSSELNVTQLIYEFISLAIPLKRVHPSDKDGKNGCDPEAIKLLNKISVNSDSNKNIDPRWESLSKLLN